MNDVVLTIGRFISCRSSTTPMEPQVQQPQSGVFKVDSKATWDSYVNQASSRNCPIVAHFTAEWCIPSVAMNSLMEELASTNEDTVFLSVDVDEVKEVANRYEIKAMPTFLLIKDGAPVDKLVGANPEEIKKRVQNLVESNRNIVVE